VLKTLGVTKQQFEQLKKNALTRERQLREAQRKLDNDDFNEECVVCLDARPNHIILDCGHLALCEECAHLFRKPDSKCPSCRAPIRKILKTYK